MKPDVDIKSQSDSYNLSQIEEIITVWHVGGAQEISKMQDKLHFDQVNQTKKKTNNTIHVIISYQWQ